MMGRTKFEPDPGQRQLVKSLAALGGRHEDIAQQIGLRSPKTLRKHFRGELDRGAAEANSQVARTLFKMATSGEYPGATMFWLKCRAGWREVNEFGHATASLPAFVVTVGKKPK
jgi:hypothetical protein